MRNFIWFVFALVALSASSCQSEEGIVTQNPTESFTKSSAISSLIMRVSQSPTSCDNVLDATSCFRVKLPIQVMVNSQYVNVVSDSDYETIQSIKDAYSNDNDVVYFEFPITIIYPNYEQVTVTNDNQWNAVMNGCGTDNGLHEISCIDFNYPFPINIYNTENQIASTVTIQDNAQLYNFVHDLDNNEVVGIVYPITLTKTNGQQVTMTNNTVLEDTIDGVIDDCASGSTPLVLLDVLTSGTWYISYCYYTHDQTSYYTGYNFTFNSNGNSIAIKNTYSVNGDWSLHPDGPFQRLDLHFDGSQLYDLETNWRVQEFTATSIRLKHEAGGGNCYYLNFTKN